jgi:hypothetical protein
MQSRASSACVALAIMAAASSQELSAALAAPASAAFTAASVAPICQTSEKSGNTAVKLSILCIAAGTCR